MSHYLPRELGTYDNLQYTVSGSSLSASIWVPGFRAAQERTTTILDRPCALQVTVHFKCLK